jgi:hypothetical protein
MSIRDKLFGKPHRVMGIRLQLVDEETGDVVSHKYARIHEIDLPAGKLHLILKSKEILIDALYHLEIEKPADMTWLQFAESQFEPEAAY